MNTENQSLHWLNENKELRMDANVDMFSEERRKFHLARYEFARTWCNDKTVLDGACGTGYGSDILGTVAREVMGIDCSADAIAYASATYSKSHVHFQKSFVESTSFPSDSFDVVVSFETVEHTLCPESHMMEVVRLLDPVAGAAILSVPNSWGYTDHHFLDFDMDTFQKLITPYFGEISFYYQNPTSHPGAPGIGKLEGSSAQDAQCILAVCTKPRKHLVKEDRYGFIMDEVYRVAFGRHHEYLALAYRQNTSLVRRVQNKLRSIASSTPKSG
jgi:2-polyprenyl-3-methyl-5-hydroxy-6-metoxy-1,4-benzoquinol methylase